MKKAIFLITFLLLISMGGVGFAEPIGAPVQGKSITGIVIDVHGMGLETAMSPRIYDENGRALTNVIPDDLNWISHNGTVDYYDADSLKEVLDGNSRVGKNFILVYATQIRDFNTNPVISVADAIKLRNLPELNDIFKKASIVFVR